jgi:quercetin dioxygenase-like cupin family protein
MVLVSALILSVLAVVGSSTASADNSNSQVRFPDLPAGDITVTPAEEVAFVAISPFAQFGPAQGDFATGAHGTFGIFGASAASPPHTHSGTYYGVVLDGDMNNPFGTEAEPPTLGPGSFWAVPADEQHVTACLSPDEECRFFFHSNGAFDFLPIDELTEERGDDAKSIPVESYQFTNLPPYDGATVVWGDPATGPYGMIVRVDGHSATVPLAHRSAVTMVPTSGELKLNGKVGPARVEPGDLLEAEANTTHSLQCQSSQDCLVYLFSDGPLEIRSPQGG